MAKDPFNDPKKPNIELVRSVRLKGEHLQGRNPEDKGSVGQVVSKKDFPNNDSWKNLCHMEPVRAEQTDLKVGSARSSSKPAPKAAKKVTENTGGMPGL